MNSSTLHVINLVIDSSIITLSSINICISAGMFAFIIYHLTKLRNSPNRVALLLTANMYLALLFSCLVCLGQYVRVLPGHVYSLISLDDEIYCQIRAYIEWVSMTAIYYSNTLQAIYRLCRIVFYKKQSLQTVRLYIIMIIIQWMISFVMTIFPLVLGDFKYSIEDYYCQIEYSNVRSLLINSTFGYVIPMYITIGCYIYTLRSMRKENNSLIRTMTQIQQKNARRDIVILFRICLLLGILTIISIPSIISLAIYIFTGYSPWWSAQIQYTVSILAIISVTISLALISPHVRHLWAKNFRRHHHNVVMPINNRIN